MVLGSLTFVRTARRNGAGINADIMGIYVRCDHINALYKVTITHYYLLYQM